MANVVRMPGISADADSAILVDWAVAPGADVRRGDVIATVETDKAVVDIEAEEDGVLLRTFATAGETVAIGGPMAVLLAPGEQATDEQRILADLGLGGTATPPTAPEAGSPADEGIGLQASGPLDAADEERSQDDVALGAVPPIPHTADQRVVPLPPKTQEDGAGVDGNGAASTPSGRTFATPLVRRLAADTGIALTELRGTGPNGRIRRRDLEAFRSAPAPVPTPPVPTPVAIAPGAAAPAAPVAAAPVPAPAARPGTDGGPGHTDEPASRFRRAVANALTASKQNVPHFYLKATCRADALLELRSRVNASGSMKVTINDFVVKAAAVALQRVPEINVSWTGDAVRHFHTVDVGVAMASERGLVVPVVRSAGGLSLSALSSTVRDLAARATANTLQQHEMEGGSLTVSNLGMYGVEEFAAIINPPQAGILAVGAVVPRAVEDADGQLVLARCLTVVLSADHRPVDGALAARWLQTFKNLIENPLEIVV